MRYRSLSNLRTWLLLVVALVPTIAMLGSGLWLWSNANEDLAQAEAASTPLEVTMLLYRSGSSIVRLEAALIAASSPHADGEVRRIAAEQLVATSAFVDEVARDTETLLAKLSITNDQQETAKVVAVRAAHFSLAAIEATKQVVGEPPTAGLTWLSDLALSEAGGVVVAAPSRDQRATFFVNASAAAIAYQNQFARDRLGIFTSLRERGTVPPEAYAGSGVRRALWDAVLNSRQRHVQFSQTGQDSIDWQLTRLNPRDPEQLSRIEPISSVISNVNLATASERNALMVELLDAEASAMHDVELGYMAAQQIFDDEVTRLQRDQRWTAFASTIVSLVGALLLGLTVSEVRARRRVERAHAMAIGQLADRAERDPTTGAWNRRRLERTLDETLRSAAERDHMVVLAYIDLDSFKAINDVWGHHTGDDVLKIVTRRLENLAFRGFTFELIRFGGDEFVVYGAGSGVDLAWLEAFGAQIVDLVGQPMAIGGRHHAVSASLGVTMSDVDSTVASMLLEADSSLILAKRGKRGQAIVYNRSVSRTGELVHALPNALANGEIFCHLQPVYDMRTGRVTHAEALARWFRPNGERVSPGVFIPLVESFGLAEELTCNMLASVGRVLDDPKTPSHVRIWVNLSPRELEVANFGLRFAAALESAAIQPSRIGLEITETAAIRDHDALARELRQVRAVGVQVAIDDFGSGYSPLGYLRDLPIDVVKIDRSLISHIDTDAANQQIVGGVIGMLDELGMAITAEGVERVEEEAWLLDHGVHAIQGFLRGRPIDPADLDWSLEVPGYERRSTRR